LGVIGRHDRSQGFTLLELLVVMFLLGLVYALGGTALDTGSSGLNLKAATRQIAAGLRKARSTAVTERRETVWSLDVEARAFQLTGDPKRYDLPGTLAYELFTAQSEVITHQAANIRFFPDGSSTGGRVMISAGETKQSIDVDWLNGRVKLL
jgi:general secretion pathway protein H